MKLSRVTALLSLAMLQPVLANADALSVPQPKTIVVFGDSITEGNMLPAEQKGFLWLLLVEKQSEGRLHLMNEGKGGRPTASVPEFDAMLARRAVPAPDLLVIALGMNDSRDMTDACVPQAVANIRAMIERGRNAWGEKLPVLLLGPSNINKDALGASKPIADPRETKLKALNAAFEALAKETSSFFFPLFGVVPPASLLRDGVHPDGPGNEAVAQAIYPVLVSLLSPRPGPSP